MRRSLPPVLLAACLLACMVRPSLAGTDALFLRSGASNTASLSREKEAPARDENSSVSRCVTDALAPFRGAFTSNETDPGYVNTLNIDNSRVVEHPRYVLFPLDEDDVACALRAARVCGLPFSVQSGGHGAGGYSLAAGGITASLSAMKAVAPDLTTGRVRIQTGALFKDVYRVVQHDAPAWTPVGGGCPYVGVGGFYLGGGWSFLSRSYGLAIDTVLNLRGVLADGTRVSANGTLVCREDPVCRELWWGWRGGGGGNFGVVTEVTAQMVQAAPRSLIGQLCWAPDTSDLKGLWDWLMLGYPAQPTWVQVDSGWLPLGPDGSRLFCHTVICNQDPTACKAFLAPLLARYGDTVVFNDLAVQPYMDWQIAHDSITSAQHGRLYLTNVMLPEGVLTGAHMERVQRAILSAPSARSLVIFHQGGGAIAEVDAAATAFPYRTSQFVMQIKAIWEGPDGDAVNMEWVADLKTMLAPLAEGSYVNYMDPLLERYPTQYYAGNLPRLQRLKGRVDPGDFFRLGQSVPPQR